jgi:hypothetical protein
MGFVVFTLGATCEKDIRLPVDRLADGPLIVAIPFDLLEGIERVDSGDLG